MSFFQEYTVLDLSGQTVSLFPSGFLALQEINSVCPSGSKTVYSFKKLKIMCVYPIMWLIQTWDFYRLQVQVWEGNVFMGVCLSVGVGGGM